jgi:hypothetical protein
MKEERGSSKSTEKVYSRRAFLRLGAEVAATGAVTYLGITELGKVIESLIMGKPSGETPFDTDSALRSINEELTTKYGISLAFAFRDTPVVEKLDAEKVLSEIRTAAQITRDQIFLRYKSDYFARFPKPFIILLVKEARAPDRDVEVTPPQCFGSPAGEAPSGGPYVIVNIDTSQASQKATLHHELIHKSDEYAEEGYDALDQKWTALHGKTIDTPYRPYKGPEDECLNQEASSVPGYIIDEEGEGWKSAREERAVAGEFMFNSEGHRRLLRRIQDASATNQKILQAKYNYIKQLFLKRSNGVMNEEYWQRILLGK